MTNELRITPRHRNSEPRAGRAVPARLASLARMATLGTLGMTGVTAPTACSDGAPTNTAVEAGLQQMLDGSVAKPGVMLPGAIAHYRNPSCRSWSGAAGLGELSAQVAMRPRDRFRAGSVLKTMLATVTLQQVEAGKLSLDQRLPALLPDTVTARIAGADQISLRMLLSHTSGIPEWVTPEVEAGVMADPARVWSSDEAIDIVSRLPARFTPGTGWSYSNTNYTLVGLVLDAVGGESWRAQVRKRVLERLALTNTSLPEPGLTTLAGSYAHGYQDVNGAVVDFSFVDPSMAGAAGGHALVTTAEDLGRFLEQLLAGALFKNRATLDGMTTMIDAPHEAGLPHRYGLGLEEFTLPNGTTVIGHGGSTAGYAVMMFRIPASDATVVTAVNTHDLFVNALEVFIPAVEVVAGSAR